MAEKKQIPLRLSEKLYSEIAAWAEDDFRSVNGQIEYLLTECVRQRRKNGKYVSEDIDKPLDIEIEWKSGSAPMAWNHFHNVTYFLPRSASAPLTFSVTSSVVSRTKSENSFSDRATVSCSRTESSGIYPMIPIFLTIHPCGR